MSSLQNKLYDYEVTPPANAWDKIAAALDESHLAEQFPAQLYNQEVTPPAAVWNKINEALAPAQAEAVVVPMQSRLSPFIRYAAAAVLIGAIAFAIIRFTTGKNVSADDMATTEITQQNNASDTNKSTAIPSPENNSVVTPIANPDDIALEKSKEMVAKLDGSTRSNKIASRTRMVQDPIAANYPSDSDISSSLYTYADHVPDMSERYIMLMTPDGNFIRMSKKWSQLLCCISGEEQDADCKDQLKKWQQKMATSPINPSPGNFMDILSMVNSLNDDSQL